MEVGPIGADEWRELRELRLRALADAPYAFASTYEGEVGKPDEWWQDWARRSADGRLVTTIVAVEGGRRIGMAGAFVQEDDPRSATVFAMWVDPAFRRRGVGRALLEALDAWAPTAGVDRLALSVTDVNDAAWALYSGWGFEETGHTQPLASNPELTEISMARRLDKPAL